MLYLKTVDENKKDIFFDITKAKTQPYKKTVIKKTVPQDDPQFRAAVASFAYIYMINHHKSDIDNIHMEEIVNGNFLNRVKEEIREKFEKEVSIARQVMKWADQDVDNNWSTNHYGVVNMFGKLFQSDVFNGSGVFVLYSEEDEEFMFEKLNQHNKNISKDQTIFLEEPPEKEEDDEDEDPSLAVFNNSYEEGVYKVLPMDKGTATFFKLSLSEDEMIRFCINI